MLLAAATLPLLGCGIRFESDAPGFLPTPSPDPAGPPILAERDRVARILETLPEAPGVATQVRSVHTAQLRALDATLGALDPPLSPSAPARAGGKTPAAPGGGDALVAVADLEADGLDEAGLAALDGIVPRAAAIVVASHAQRAVLLELLAAAGTAVAPAARTPWHAASPAIARALVDDLRATAYGVEVAAAHLPPGPRGTVLAGLGVLRDAESRLGALVPDLPPRPLGYRLPRPVTNPREAVLLATGVLDRFVAATLAAAPTTADARRTTRPATQDEPGDDTRADVASPAATAGSDGSGDAGATTTDATTPPGDDAATLVRLVRIAELTRVRCGGPLRPLPGLRPPATPSPTASPPPRT
ncbi:hypothetical protein MOPEL_100_00050 [Mobilicoccus pelagius NBRC 104925]|uniref:DUF4439 domain-containing protein n=2 Tax=Mobilicoccus TaxID=984996 RepID=H5UUA9_9MICO|nr:hypothetical protein MOPEL_100_00050 [Mobilicoccus pelagius NBRC 104925]